LRIFSKTWLSLCLLATLVACSSRQFVYEHADWFIGRYADSYLDLSSEQQARWEPRLQSELALHKREDLPQVIEFLGRFEHHLGEPLDGGALECLSSDAEALYRRLARRAVNLAVPVLQGLVPAQVDYLEDELQEAREEYRERYLDPDIETRIGKRAERIVSRITDFTGSLSDEQEAMIRSASRAMPDAAQDWLDYKRRQQEELLRLLRGKADTGALRRHLTAWWVDLDGQSPALKAKVAATRTRAMRLVEQLDDSLSDRQRQSLVAAIGELRSDLLAVLPQRQSPVDMADATALAAGGAGCIECPCRSG
jgi:hypothetical protein